MALFSQITLHADKVSTPRRLAAIGRQVRSLATKSLRMALGWGRLELLEGLILRATALADHRFR